MDPRIRQLVQSIFGDTNTFGFGPGNMGQNFLSGTNYTPGLMEAFFPNVQRQTPFGYTPLAFQQLQGLSAARAQARQAQLQSNPIALNMAQRFMTSTFGMSQQNARNMLMNPVTGQSTTLGSVVSQVANATMPFLGDPAGRAMVAGELQPFFSGARFGGATQGIRGMGTGLRPEEVQRLTEFFQPTVSGRFQGGGVTTRFDTRTAFDVMRMGAGAGLFAGVGRGGQTPLVGQQPGQLGQMERRISEFVELMDASSGLLEGLTKEDTFQKLMNLSQGNIAVGNRQQMERAARDIRALADTADVSVGVMMEIANRGTALAGQLGITGTAAVGIGRMFAAGQNLFTPVMGQGVFTPEQIAMMGGPAQAQAAARQNIAQTLADPLSNLRGMALRTLGQGQALGGLTREQIMTGNLTEVQLRNAIMTAPGMTRQQLEVGMQLGRGTQAFAEALTAQGPNQALLTAQSTQFERIMRGVPSNMREALRTAAKTGNLDEFLATQGGARFAAEAQGLLGVTGRELENRLQMMIGSMGQGAQDRAVAQDAAMRDARLAGIRAEDRLTAPTLLERLAPEGVLAEGLSLGQLIAATEETFLGLGGQSLRLVGRQRDLLQGAMTEARSDKERKVRLTEKEGADLRASFQKRVGSREISMANLKAMAGDLGMQDMTAFLERFAPDIFAMQKDIQGRVAFADIDEKTLERARKMIPELALGGIASSKEGMAILARELGFEVGAEGVTEEQRAKILGMVDKFVMGDLTAGDAGFEALSKHLGKAGETHSFIINQVKRQEQARASRIGSRRRETRERSGEILFEALGRTPEGRRMMDVSGDAQTAIFERLQIDKMDEGKRQEFLSGLATSIREEGVAGMQDFLAKQLPGFKGMTAAGAKETIAALRGETIAGGGTFEEALMAGGRSAEDFGKFKEISEKNARAAEEAVQVIKNIESFLRRLLGIDEEGGIEGDTSEVTN